MTLPRRPAIARILLAILFALLVVGFGSRRALAFARYPNDGNSNLLTVTEGAAVLTRSYDARNRVSSYTNAAGEVVGYEYDANGNLTKLTYPDAKTVSYAYDDRNRLVSVTDWASRVTTFTWDANSQCTQIVRPNGSVRRMSYDAAGQVTRVEEKKADGRLIHLQQFGYDAAGRISSRFMAPLAAPFYGAGAERDVRSG